MASVDSLTTPKLELFYDVGSTNSYVFRHHNYVLMDEPKAKLINRKRDLQRWAERYDLPFVMPKRFPIKTSPALRGALAARRLGSEEAFLFAVFARYWEANDGTIDEVATLGQIAESVGLDKAEFLALVDSEDVRAELVDATNAALAQNIFGAPSIRLGGELYWGKDRMEFVEDHLQSLLA